MPTKQTASKPSTAKPASKARANKAAAPVVPPTPVKRGPKNPLTDEHKTAMVKGRSESKAVGNYLDALKSTSRPGRRRTAESIAARLAAIDEQLPDAAGIEALKLRQERLDLRAEFEALSARRNDDELEAGFVAHAKSFGERHGISYAAWRETGVSAAALRKAGIAAK